MTERLAIAERLRDEADREAGFFAQLAAESEDPEALLRARAWRGAAAELRAAIDELIGAQTARILGSAPEAPEDDTLDLVGRAEIAQRAGTTIPMVDTWRQRHTTFPAPVAVLANRPIWSWPDVARWIAMPRMTGRPRRA